MLPPLIIGELHALLPPSRLSIPPSASAQDNIQRNAGDFALFIVILRAGLAMNTFRNTARVASRGSRSWSVGRLGQTFSTMTRGISRVVVARAPLLRSCSGNDLHKILPLFIRGDARRRIAITSIPIAIGAAPAAELALLISGNL